MARVLREAVRLLRGKQPEGIAHNTRHAAVLAAKTVDEALKNQQAEKASDLPPPVGK